MNQSEEQISAISLGNSTGEIRVFEKMAERDMCQYQERVHDYEWNEEQKFVNIVFFKFNKKVKLFILQFFIYPNILRSLLNEEIRFGKVRHQNSVYKKLQSNK